MLEVLQLNLTDIPSTTVLSLKLRRISGIGTSDFGLALEALALKRRKRLPVKICSQKIGQLDNSTE